MTRFAPQTFALVLLSAWVAPPWRAGAQVKVGAVSCLTGELSTFGVSSIQGARLAVDDLNGRGGGLGQKLELLVEDNGSKAGEATTIARKLLTQYHVAAILGDLTSSATMEAAPLAQAAGVPLLTPTATGEQITRIGNYIFRSCFLNSFSGQVMARFALDRFKATRAVVLTDVKQDYSVGLAAVIKAYFEGHGGRDVVELSFTSGDTDFRAQLTRARAFRPDVIFVPAYYPEAGLILRQARQLEIKAQFVGGEGWDSPTLLQVENLETRNLPSTVVVMNNLDHGPGSSRHHQQSRQCGGDRCIRPQRSSHHANHRGTCDQPEFGHRRAGARLAEHQRE